MTDISAYTYRSVLEDYLSHCLGDRLFPFETFVHVVSTTSLFVVSVIMAILMPDLGVGVAYIGGMAALLIISFPGGWGYNWGYIFPNSKVDGGHVGPK